MKLRIELNGGVTEDHLAQEAARARTALQLHGHGTLRLPGLLRLRRDAIEARKTQQHPHRADEQDWTAAQHRRKREEKKISEPRCLVFDATQSPTFSSVSLRIN